MRMEEESSLGGGLRPGGAPAEQPSARRPKGGGTAATGHSGIASSFDIFDTFLLRRCTTPDGVFELACRHAGADCTRPGLVESFVQHRQLAERAAREQSARHGHDGEVSIEAIYAKFPRRLFGLAALSPEELAEAEFRAELDLCFADLGVLSLYDEARNQGRRTGFISDTYWGAERLARLLRHCRPGLTWDFLYASCDHHTGKSRHLFDRVLAKERLAPAELAHLGDHPVADLAAPRRLGIAATPHPQATPWLAGVLQREDTIFSLATYGVRGGRRLDGGLRTLRRRIAGSIPAGSAAEALGIAVLGPVMAAFDRFVSARVARLEQDGRRVAVAFLARDGALARALWDRLYPERPAIYLEINRRTAALAGADAPCGFAPLLDPIEVIDHASAVDMLGIDSPTLKRFFLKAGGTTSGRALAAALPRLFDRKIPADLAAGMRGGLLAHLRREIADFDAVTDLVLVDLGYGGSVQKGLRRALDLAGGSLAGKRLHGVYLVGRDAALDDLSPDTAESLVSGLVVPPQVTLALLSNIAVLEQLCVAPTGSVRCYRDGMPVRETDHRDAGQIAIAAQAQAGALRFASALADMTGGGRPDPFADHDTAAPWTAAMLGRLLLLPTDDEVLLLGGITHDVNLGSRSTMPLVDARMASRAVLARPLPNACTVAEPPMWPAGSLAAVSPQHGFAYALFAAGALPGDVFADAPCGRVEVTLVDHHRAAPLAITCMRTPAGDLRLQVPLLADHPVTAVAIPVGQLAPRALVRGIALQQGRTAAAAMASRTVTMIGPERIRAVEATLVNDVVIADQNGALVVLPPPLEQQVAVLTVQLTPLGHARPLALTLEEPSGETAASAPEA